MKSFLKSAFIKTTKIGKACLGVPGLKAPVRRSFEEFLLNDARVPGGRGIHKPYSFQGREALLAIVRAIDRVLGAPVSDRRGGDGSSPAGQTQRHGAPVSDPARFKTRARKPGQETGAPLPDAEISLAGGAQFGKTLLELNLAAYLTGQQFRNFGLYLPDDDLVEGIVDSKFRPDVVDQIRWFAKMTQVGKALNQSGRAVNRKGAFLVTDGRRKAVGVVRGLGKVPTAFSMDVAAMDELDDLQPRRMKFVRGRLAASDLRFILKIGTQRIHGRGMNLAWKDGSQGVFNFRCMACGKVHNPEEEFPQIVRLRSGTGVSPVRFNLEPHGQDARATTDAPKLTWSGDFKLDGSEEAVATHEPSHQYYLGCVDCGAELDRTRPIETHRQPALIIQRKWSFRISQLAIAAIDLSQIVGRFQSAVADPEEMVVFRCDVLALPQSTSQALTPAILDRARLVAPFDLVPQVSEGNVAFGGLDMGDRCWLFAREILGGGDGSSPDSPAPRETSPYSIFHYISSAGPRPVPPSALPSPSSSVSRLLTAHKIPAGDVIVQAQVLFHQLGLTALFIDERPLVNEARHIALALNGLQALDDWPRIPNPKEAWIELPGGLTWDGRQSRWLNLKCALVRFTKNKLGSGLEQTIVFFEEGGQTKFVPCIACNRFETIDRVVRELLTPAEGVVELAGPTASSCSSLAAPKHSVSGPAIRQTPRMLLPRRAPGQPPILDLVDAHFITGSERLKDANGSLGDYADGCENHLLLANAYSALAAILCGSKSEPPFIPLPRVHYIPEFVAEG